MTRNFSLLGPPASGKGTQGRRLAERFAVPYLSTGACLRREIERGSAIGQQAEGYLARNEFVPDSLAVDLVRSWLSEHDGGWVLDGFPRSLPQAEALVMDAGTNFQAIALEVPREELVRRVGLRRECVKCGRVAKEGEPVCPNCGGEWTVRDDDTPEKFRKRYEVYKNLTVPVLDFFEGRGQLTIIDGLGDRDVVWERIEEKL
ncbi:MAG: nucleoside monophosphate kinase [Verrucomicrobiota bacterium JB023]|nr:nucleoside monophosphate kinase [Verrucomicrobiota bacterium JB023]